MSVAATVSVPSRLAQYYALTKPRVVQLIVFCALIGMVLAVPGAPSWSQVQLAALACLGIWLVAGAAAAFNCVVEQQIDAKMKRTAWRPTAKGQLTNWQTLSFSAALCAAGSAILYWWVNPLTMWLTFATFVGYAVIYTVILKPLTPQNIVIGGASGAMPPVLGWAAMTNMVAPEALILFLIIFLWTPPHFWALALYRVEDYRKSGLPMLPVTHGNEFTRLQILLYTIVLMFAMQGNRIIEAPLGWGNRNEVTLTNPVIRDGMVVGGTFSNVRPVLRNDLNTQDDKIFAAGWNHKFRFNDQWTAGLLGGMSEASLKPQVGGRTKVDANTLGAYLTYTPGNGFYADFSYRSMDFDGNGNAGGNGNSDNAGSGNSNAGGNSGNPGNSGGNGASSKDSTTSGDKGYGASAEKSNKGKKGD